MQSKLQLTGIGLRTPHMSEFLDTKPGVAWVEVHSENYFGEGGRPTHHLEQVRKDYPVSLHGVSMSLGSADDLNWQHLNQLRDLHHRIDACLISEHLSWSSLNGQYFHDLLPLPYTEEALEHVSAKIQQVQEFLNKQILIENISAYLSYLHSTIPEWEFIAELSKRSGCGILLDVNNIYVSSVNLGFNPFDFINAIPADAIQEIHLAGFSASIVDGKEVLVDTHNNPVVPAVWDIFRYTIERVGPKPTIIEWDTDLPTLDKLCMEAYRSEEIIREAYVATKRTG